MRFKDRTAEKVQMVETLCLILSLGAIFIQIWILASSMESYLRGGPAHLGAAVIMSGIGLACCALAAFTTIMPSVEPEEEA